MPAAASSTGTEELVLELTHATHHLKDRVAKLGCYDRITIGTIGVGLVSACTLVEPTLEGFGVSMHSAMGKGVMVAPHDSHGWMDGRADEWTAG